MNAEPVDTALRENLVALLRALADAGASGTFREDPVELCCGWFDDLYHPDTELLRTVFAPAERDALAAFHAEFRRVADLKPDLSAPGASAAAPEWRRIGEAAATALARLDPTPAAAMWPRVCGWFADHGPLRDLVVAPTTLADQEAFVRALPGWGHRIAWFVDGEPSVPFPSAADAFAFAETAQVLLRIDVGPLRPFVLFTVHDELEVTIEPAHVHDEAAFAALLGFVRQLGDLLQRRVALSFELSPELEILRYEPSPGRFTFAALPT